MSGLDKVKIVAETADKLGVDPLTKSVASMAAVFIPALAVSIVGMGVNAKMLQKNLRAFGKEIEILKKTKNRKTAENA